MCVCVNVCHGDLFATPFVASKPKEVRIKNLRYSNIQNKHKIKTHATKHFAAKTNGICPILGNFFNFEAVPHGVAARIVRWLIPTLSLSSIAKFPFSSFLLDTLV